jgi:hypothetical protein
VSHKGFGTVDLLAAMPPAALTKDDARERIYILGGAVGWIYSHTFDRMAGPDSGEGIAHRWRFFREKSAAAHRAQQPGS